MCPPGTAGMLRPPARMHGCRASQTPPIHGRPGQVKAAGAAEGGAETKLNNKKRERKFKKKKIKEREKGVG